VGSNGSAFPSKGEYSEMDFEGEYVRVENGPSPMMMRTRRGAASSAFHAGPEDGEALQEKGCAAQRSWCLASQTGWMLDVRWGTESGQDRGVKRDMRVGR
jgi:hypothetical protein